jgi:YfiR/HmsC-like
MHHLRLSFLKGRGRRWGRMASLCLSLMALLASEPGFAASPRSLEKAVKASFLIKFVPFVEWPPAAFTASDKMFMICVMGEDPFGKILNDVVRGQKIRQRPVGVRRLDPMGDPAGCHILYVGRSPEADYTPFAMVGGQPVLTVTDRGGGPPGAMIEFVMQNGRVRFQIDDSAARANGLKISSKLLGLAIAVNRK